jgi:hypothetical protein
VDASDNQWPSAVPANLSRGAFPWRGRILWGLGLGRARVAKADRGCRGVTTVARADQRCGPGICDTGGVMPAPGELSD